MTHDHDTVVVERNGGSGVGAILGVIVVLALIIGFWFFAFGPGKGTFGGSTNSGTDINVNVELRRSHRPRADLPRQARRRRGGAATPVTRPPGLSPGRTLRTPWR